ncbi:putative disease resistance protein [Cardamine amara subsp. amara]|uniref:Disease resistance protein n=1 Tax=Cardamine amara subsp. amara TaxID=228776 RepID=A0ABD1B6C5_CARAN
MAETLLSFGVQKLWDFLVRESDRLKGVAEHLTELKSDLNLLRSFLKDADAKRNASDLVRNCVEEIKEIVFDTEDIIQTFLLKEELSKTSGIKKRMRRLSCLIVDRLEIASDMGGISKRISKVIRDMQSFGVQQMIVDGGEYSHPLQERQREMRKTYPNNNENNLVGLEKNVKKLVGYLVEEDIIQVVSITGMGGIGKTTLARQVFNHEMVKNHFDGVAWVCISQQFTAKDVWKTILQKLSSNYDEQRDSNMSEDELQEKLSRLLETSKSLIVLDDMWKEGDWDRIKHVFPSKKGYWKLLLTSRNERVGLRADPTCVTFKPECLTIEESLTLFRSIAFPRKDTAEYKVDVDMEEMGKQMIKHCGGLPLAVKVLGGLLAAQHTLSEWERVYANIGSHLAGTSSFNDEDSSSVYYVLSLSFEELPSYLKHCFLYLAHVPEDYPINVETLSYLLAADEIPRTSYYDGASIREVTNGYIEELVRRNMVIAERDTRTSRFERFQLHDMMREVCLRKAKEDKFVYINDTANSQSPCESRRIAVHRLDESYDPKGMIKNPKLRSLLFFCFAKGMMPSDLLFTRLKLLRVLNLSYAKLEGGKLPSSIGKLIHLRYLSLYMAEVTNLPSSMRNLKQLLYLNLLVSSSSPLHMPNNVLNEMRELRYLYLPRVIDDKVKMELDNLVNLETLENFSTEHCSVRDLHRMTRLDRLSIKVNGGCTMETLFSSLSELRHLDGGCTMETLSSSLSELRHLNNLIIIGYTNVEEGFVLDCVHLKHLKLNKIYMPRLPDEQHFPSHLTTLSLEKCRLEEDPMPILENLLQLKEVGLYNESFSGRRMVCSVGGFPQLQKLWLWGLEEWEEWIVEEGSMPLLHTLSIWNCEKWEEWIVEEGSMPLLHTLEIGYCHKLKELPDGLRFITSLKELIIETVHLEFKEKLLRGGEDFYKVEHIPLLKIKLKGESYFD